jgi:hypothetical protein
MFFAKVQKLAANQRILIGGYYTKQPEMPADPT